MRKKIYPDMMQDSEFILSNCIKVTIKERNEELKFTIARFDHYYDSVNNKGNLYVAINTFILAGAITGYVTLDAKHHFAILILILFIITIVSNFVSFCFTLAAIKPYFNKVTSKSLIYFYDIANLNDSQFKLIWENLNDKNWHDDLVKQSKRLSEGLSNKFQLLKIATWFIGLEIFLIAIFGIYFLLTF
jgi:Family of unknown function (DUF5706)